jgi:DNA mismatch endonuclease (patch repair protein)
VSYKEDEQPIKVPRFSEKSGFYTTAKRSKIMSKIRGKDTKPEILLRKALWKEGIRYRKDFKKLPDKPDIAVPMYKLAIFVDGEYWHGYDWENRKSKIKTNRDFWIPKLERNMQREREVNSLLKDLGYTVMRFWSKEVFKNLDVVIATVKNHINDSRSKLEAKK